MISEKEIMARLASLEARLTKLDGGAEEDGAKKAPASKITHRTTNPVEFPKWVYAIVDGELKSALIQNESEMPDEAFESPEEAKAALTEPKIELVAIPSDWREIHHSSRIKLAQSLPDGEGVATNDDAIAFIELELERRGNG